MLCVNRAHLYAIHLTFRLSIYSADTVSFLFRVTMDSLAPSAPRGPLEKRSGSTPCTFSSENL